MVLRYTEPEIALVSNALPPGASGYQFMLEQLFGAIPPNKLALVGIGGPWGGRPQVPFPARRNAPARAESLIAAGAVTVAERLAPWVYRAMLPNVRRIFATLDPTLPFALGWAKGTGTELWIYAIDLHCDGYWAAGDFLREHLLARRLEAFRYATRILAISEPMADWLRDHGVTAKIDIVPPLYPVGERAPLPGGPHTFLMSGVVYSINAGPLRWLERAVSDLAPSARLRLLTTSGDEEIRKAGLDVARWSKARVAPAEVPGEVARATWGVMGCDSGKTVDGERVVWPTKLREYLSLGRPILCIARPENAVARAVINSKWGIFAFGEEQTRAAVARIAAESPADLEERSRAAHDFARANIDDAKVGAAIRRDLFA